MADDTIMVIWLYGFMVTLLVAWSPNVQDDESMMEEFSAPITELIETFSGVKAAKAG